MTEFNDVLPGCGVVMGCVTGCERGWLLCADVVVGNMVRNGGRKRWNGRLLESVNVVNVWYGELDREDPAIDAEPEERVSTLLCCLTDPWTAGAVRISQA